MFAYSTDLDLREIMEDFMQKEISPQTSQSKLRHELTKAEVLNAVRILNEG